MTPPDLRAIDSVGGVVRELHARGLSRNAIAKEIGRSTSTVSTIAKQLGLSFDRSATRAATSARVVDAEAHRAELVAELQHQIGKLLRRLDGPYISVHPAKDGTAVATRLDRVTPAAARDLASAVASLAASVSRLSSIRTADDGLEGAISLIDSVAAGIKRQAALMESEEGRELLRRAGVVSGDDSERDA